MAPSVNTTSKADMIAAFPDAVPKINDAPNLREIIRVMHHLMQCSQSHASDASTLGLLFACLPQIIWSAYSPDDYPQDPQDPGAVLTINEAWTPNEVLNYKAQWEHAKKRYEDFKTMNSALTDRFCSLIKQEFTADFTHMRISQPDTQFRQCLMYFLGKYGKTNETERAENKQRMRQQWTLQDGWERLQKQLDEGSIFGLFADQPIPEAELVDIGITVIGQTGLFAAQYEQWHERPADQKTWRHFCQFWKDKIQLKRDTNLNAGQFGFGGNANEEGGDVDMEFNNSVANFAQAHQQTQSTISNLTNTNAQLQQTIQQMQWQMGQMANSANQQRWNDGSNGGGNNNNSNNNYSGGRNKKKKKKKQSNSSNNNSGWTGYGGNGNNNNAGSTSDRPPHVKLFNNDNYCWTHGHDLSGDHNSMTCFNRHCNHQAAATKDNTMGGNPNGAEKTVWPRVAGFPEYVPKRNRGNQQQKWQQPAQQQQQQWGGNAMQQQPQQHQQQQYCMPAGQPSQQYQQPPMMPQQQQQQYGGFAQQYMGPPPGFQQNVPGGRFF